jgi:hypothetical protein
MKRDRLEHCPQLVKAVSSHAEHAKVEVDLGVRAD